ncbi:TetR family transcriptional regulator [Salinisphaera sp. S4-8]|uniref:TetR/AcrR family transcriptional regulator n=1 Tax=Salinisphaera sp. S4-8 TaxID=633357 RepID=UPI003341DF5F
MATNAHSNTRKKSQLTRGHKKKARTRQQLLDAALRIYARAGVGGLALNALAEEAGVSNGTIYNYFRSREQVLEAVGLELAIQLSEQILVASEAVDSGAERLCIAVRTFMNKALSDPDWTRALISVVRYAEGMRSALGSYLRADLQAGHRQGDFHYANEEMAMSIVISATLGAMNLLVEQGPVEHADRIAAKMVLQALGVPDEQARHIAELPLPGAQG